MAGSASMVQGVLMKENGQHLHGDEQEKKLTEQQESHENQSIGQVVADAPAQQSQVHENQAASQLNKPRETKQIQRGTHRSRGTRAQSQRQPDQQQKIPQPQNQQQPLSQPGVPAQPVANPTTQQPEQPNK